MSAPPAIASVAPSENSVEVVYRGWSGWPDHRHAKLSVLAATDADGRLRTLKRVWTHFAKIPYETHLPINEQHVRGAERCFLIGPEPYDARRETWKIAAIVNVRGERRLVDAELMPKEPRRKPPIQPEHLPSEERAKYFEDLIRSDITTGKKVSGYYRNEHLTTLIASVLG